MSHFVCHQNNAAMAKILIQRLFVSNRSDKVAANKEVTTSNTNDQETLTQMTLAQELNAFVADDKNEEEQYNNASS